MNSSNLYTQMLVYRMSVYYQLRNSPLSLADVTQEQRIEYISRKLHGLRTRDLPKKQYVSANELENMSVHEAGIQYELRSDAMPILHYHDALLGQGELADYQLPNLYSVKLRREKKNYGPKRLVIRNVEKSKESTTEVIKLIEDEVSTY